MISLNCSYKSKGPEIFLFATKKRGYELGYGVVEPVTSIDNFGVDLGKFGTKAFFSALANRHTAPSMRVEPKYP